MGAEQQLGFISNFNTKHREGQPYRINFICDATNTPMLGAHILFETSRTVLSPAGLVHSQMFLNNLLLVSFIVHDFPRMWSQQYLQSDSLYRQSKKFGSSGPPTT